MSALAQCPQCGRDITAADGRGMVACECGYSGYLGYLQEYTYLLQRQRWVWDRMQERQPPPAEPLATRYGIWRVTSTGATPAIAARGGSLQVLLVTLGALLLLLAGTVFVAVAWDLIGPVGQLAALAVATGIAIATAVALRTRTPRTAEALAVVGFGLAAITAAAAAGLGVIPQPWTTARYPYWLAVTAALLTFGVVVGRSTGLQAWTWLGWLTAPFVLGTALGLVLGRVENDQIAMTGAALAYLLLTAALFVSGSPPRIVSGALSLVPVAMLTLALLTNDPPSGAILVIAAMLLLLLVVPGGGQWREWTGFPLLALWLTLLAGLLPDTPAVSALVAVGGGVLAFALSPRSPLLAMLSAGTLWTVGLLTRSDDASLYLALVAVSLYALAWWRRDAAPVAWLGALAAQTALLLEWRQPPFFEAPTLVLAGLLLAAGLLQWRAGQRRSAVVVAPAVTVALIPAALLSWVDVWSTPSLIRFGVVLATGLVLLLVGVQRHVLGLVIPAAVAIGIAATAQVLATLDLLPRWLALALVGGLLILAGARLEWLRARRRETQDWLESLR